MHLKKLIGLFLVLVCASTSSIAQNQKYPDNNMWIHSGDIGGVTIYWRFRQELSDQFIAELKFTNNNGYKVDVSFRSHYVCDDGRDVVAGTASLITLRPGQTVGGQWAGLFDYPCPGTPPREGGVKGMTVKQAQ